MRISHASATGAHESVIIWRFVNTSVVSHVARSMYVAFERASFISKMESLSRVALLVEGNHGSKFAHKMRPPEHCSLLAVKWAPTQGRFRHSLRSSITRFLGGSRKHRASYCMCLQPGGSLDTSFTSEGLETRAESSNTFSNNEAFKVSHDRTVELLDQSMDIENKGLLQQMGDIVMFAGPALGIWLSGPIMSMIDTAVVGNSSLLELAALGPGTVFCDQLGYLFMFLSVATSNLIATSMAKQDKVEAANHLSRLLFVSLVCGICMLILTGAFSSTLLKAFVGPKNESLLPAACSYVQIRGLAWPAVLVGLVAQSASLGMKDAWGPLRVLAIASILNLSGDIILCTLLKYGIAGAAWATTISQFVAGYLMLMSLGSKGYDPFAFVRPSLEEFSYMLKLAAPVLLTIFSKVCFFSLVTYMSTALGAVTLAAHQVMAGLFGIFSVSAEPLNQTAQSFMPGLIQGSMRNVKKAQVLLRSLLVIGFISGALLGATGTCFSLFFPRFFTSDGAVILQMRAVIMPFLWSLVVTPPLLSLEGTLLAGRDLKYLSQSMAACVVGSSTLLMVCRKMEWGLGGIWWTVACFMTIRFCMALSRLASSNSVIRDDSSKDAPTLKYWKPS